jgi:hypothetical protein
MISRKFERHELVMVVRLTRRWQRLIRNGIIAGIAREIIAPRLALCSYHPAPIEI